jgi:hypothetical protein
MSAQKSDTEVAGQHPRAGSTSGPRLRPRRATGGVRLAQQRSAPARQQAAAILEVLAGTRTPGQAAAALGMSLPRYYQVEQRALEGLVAACEPQAKGRGVTPASVAAKLRRDNERLQRELSRQQALVRLTQRHVGLPPPAPAAKASGKKRPRRPVVRALAVAQRLQQPGPAPPASASASAPAALTPTGV